MGRINDLLLKPMTRDENIPAPLILKPLTRLFHMWKVRSPGTVCYCQAGSPS